MAHTSTEAFRRLVREHEAQVVRVCRSILRDEHLGADAAQETFLRLWNRIRERREPERHGAWLRRVAVTAALDLKRRRQTRMDAAEVLERPEEGIGAEAPPEGEASAAELRRSLEAALERLPEGQRTVFLLRYQGGLTLEEVGRSLGIAHSTVRTQFARACLKLQDRLRPHGKDLDEPS